MKNKTILFTIIVIAIILRLGYYFQYSKNLPYQKYMKQVDAEVYHNWAVDTARGDIIGEGVFSQSPFYPYFLSIFYRIFGIDPSTVLFLQFILGMLSLFLIYLIAQNLFDEKVAIISLIIALFYPLFIFYETKILITTLAIFLNLLGLYLLLISVKKEKVFLWYIYGLILGINVITRPNNLIFIPFVFLYLLYKYRRESLKRLGPIIFGLFITIFPITLRNYVVGKDFCLTSSNGGIVFYVSNFDNANGIYNLPAYPKIGCVHNFIFTERYE